jgi:hypothetical protein
MTRRSGLRSMERHRLPNKWVQATPGGAVSSAVADLAFWPGVPGMCSQSYSTDGEEGPATPPAVGGE